MLSDLTGSCLETLLSYHRHPYLLLPVSSSYTVCNEVLVLQLGDKLDLQRTPIFCTGRDRGGSKSFRMIGNF